MTGARASIQSSTRSATQVPGLVARGGEHRGRGRAGHRAVGAAPWRRTAGRGDAVVVGEGRVPLLREGVQPAGHPVGGQGVEGQVPRFVTLLTPAPRAAARAPRPKDRTPNRPGCGRSPATTASADAVADNARSARGFICPLHAGAEPQALVAALDGAHGAGAA